MKDGRRNPHPRNPGNQALDNEACRPDKKPWQSPEIMEADYGMTETSLTYGGTDAGLYS